MRCWDPTRPLPILRARQGREKQHEVRTEVTHPGLPSSRYAIGSVSGGQDPYVSFHPGERWLCVPKWDNLTPGEASSAVRDNFVLSRIDPMESTQENPRTRLHTLLCSGQANTE